MSVTTIRINNCNVQSNNSKNCFLNEPLNHVTDNFPPFIWLLFHKKTEQRALTGYEKFDPVGGWDNGAPDPQLLAQHISRTENVNKAYFGKDRTWSIAATPHDSHFHNIKPEFLTNRMTSKELKKLSPTDMNKIENASEITVDCLQVPKSLIPDITNSFNAWSDVSGLKFRRVQDSGGGISKETSDMGHHTVGLFIYPKLPKSIYPRPESTQDAGGVGQFPFANFAYKMDEVTGQLVIDHTSPPQIGGQINLGINECYLGKKPVSSLKTLTPSGIKTTSHEIGHAALGLIHPHQDCNNIQQTDKFGSVPDQRTGTVMSYISPRGSSGTPTIADVEAARLQWGPSHTRLGNDTYGYNATPDNPLLSFSPAKKSLLYFNDGIKSFTIVDDGGQNTINFSQIGKCDYSAVVDMHEGKYSLIVDSVKFEKHGLFKKNKLTVLEDINVHDHSIRAAIGISYGTKIHNVITGSKADRVYGNDLDNNISTGGGNDHIWGGGGNDTINGGVGFDISYFKVNYEDAFIDTEKNSKGDIITTVNTRYPELQKLTNVERLRFLNGYADFKHGKWQFYPFSFRVPV